MSLKCIPENITTLSIIVFIILYIQNIEFPKKIFMSYLCQKTPNCTELHNFKDVFRVNMRHLCPNTLAMFARFPILPAIIPHL